MKGPAVAEAKFEKDLERLEQVVESLEEGGLPLDEALKKFEEGIRLAKRCETALNTAEKKIEMLTKNAKGELVAQPFGEDECPPVPESSGENEAASSVDGEDDDEDEGNLLF